MIYALCIITVLYALLNIIAALLQMIKTKQKDTSAAMQCGGLFLLFASNLHMRAIPYSWIFAAIGGLLICIAAFINGRRSESFHASHHIIRLVITLALVAGFIFIK